MSERVYRSSLTAKRIASRKGVLLACAALAAVTDVFVLAVLGAGGFAGVYFVGPSILLAADVLFLLCAVFSNFRFRYSVLWVALYLAVTLAMTVLTIFLNMETGVAVITKAAEISWIAVHALVLAAVLFAALYAAKLRAFARGAVTAVFAALLLAATCFYAAFLFGNGFFGQGFGGGLRTLTYTYNEEEGYYEVTGVLEGSGDTVVVPESFDGQPVGALDCGVFAAEGVSVVRFERDGDLVLNNTRALSYVANDLTVYADREHIDELRVLFYELAESAAVPENALRVANGFRPLGLEEGEIYVTFSYTVESYAVAEGNILPTWYGREGEAFDLRAYEAEYPYLAHADKTSDEDLHWGYTEFGGWILGDPADDSLASLLGQTLTESASVTVGFERVYPVYIGEDNDDLYETAEDYKQTSVGGQTLGYRYAVPSTVQDLLDELPARDGFTVAWEYTEGGGSRLPLSDAASVLRESENRVTVYPVWALEPASVSISSENGFSVVYGAEVTLGAVVGSPVEGMDVSFSWTSPDGDAGSGAECELGVPTPSQSGTYGVTVTLSSDTITSLTAEASASAELEIAKKQLEFTWTLPSDLTYRAADKAIVCEAAAGQAVGSDELTYSLSRDSVRDAGDYTITLTLTGDTAEKYAIASGHASRSFTIQPYEAEVQWGAASFTYDGEEHLPTATAQGVGEDGELSLTVSGGKTDAGDYTAYASVENGNYTLKNAEHSFTIGKRQITVSFWESGTLTYDGSVQYPNAAALGNIVAGEEAETLALLGYTVTAGGGRDAGAHTVQAQLPETANYAFDTEQTRDYTIKRRGAALVWQTSTELTYNGSAQGIEVVGGAGLSGSLLTEFLNDLSCAGAQTDAGEYTMTASLGAESNFAIEGSAEQGYTILPRTVTVSRWSGSSFTYNGEAQRPSAEALGNVVAADEDAALGALTYTVGGGDGTDAGTYTVQARLAESGVSANYVFAAEQTHGYTIKKRGVTLIWEEERTFTYDGTAKSIEVVGAEGLSGSLLEELLADLRYDGASAEAGTHTMTAQFITGRNFAIEANATCTYTIEPQTVTLSWLDDTAEFVWDGTPKSPVAACNKSGVAFASEYRNERGVLLGSAPSDVGTYTVTVRVTDGNYSAEPLTMQFSIVADGGEVTQ